MVSREKRLHEVFEHLRKFFGIHTQTDFAVALKYSRVYISSALNGNEKNLTDKLFENICEPYPGVFDLNYLLTGEGSLLTIEEEVKSEDIEKTYNPQPIDNSSLVNAVIAAKDETIATLQARIVDLERTIADKEEIIKARDARIVTLERQLAAATTGDLSHYPFTIGAAEDKQPHI